MVSVKWRSGKCRQGEGERGRRFEAFFQISKNANL
jgi:hypothetical protein